MPIQSEAQLEANLIRQLTEQGYTRAIIKDEKDLLDNLKNQLEKHNKTRFSTEEFDRILNHLDKGNVFQRAHTLRDHMNLVRDNGNKEHIQFLNTHHWCRNQFQVTNQITQTGARKNRYDVSLLINGLPLVHIELKRRGMEIKQAFNQVGRYHRQSFKSGYGLFSYIQIFVISNGVNTKYFTNDHKQNFLQTFCWTNQKNKPINRLELFTDTFLEKCHIAKMICRHIVLHETEKRLMVLRPYQVYAAERIIERVENTRGHGYIWHTTGSGKTLTSFKAAQILCAMPEIDKVLFVVDRLDLDYQTMSEFNNFQKGSVDESTNTKKLVNSFADPEKKLILTTIQKLHSAIKPDEGKKRPNKHKAAMAPWRDKRVVFIFDECHRSQFGDTHQNITKHFENAQLFGFTGTPIFADNAAKGIIGTSGTRLRTTANLFNKCLHRYVITDAIRDDNVLPFSVEHWGKLKRKDGTLIDEEVPGLNTKEFFESDDRIDKIIDRIIKIHNQKTHDRAFSAILATGSITAACSYYDRFKALKDAGKHDLTIATVFTSPVNEDDKDADGHLPAEKDPAIEAPAQGSSAREKMDGYINSYNAQFGTSFNTNTKGGFYGYYKDIGRRIKSMDREDFDPKNRIDILIVVSMYLTGFDAKKLSALYVDKNLRYQGVIQAFSRTNRTFNAQKSHGNIVCFRNLKNAIDEALRLFADENAKQTVLLEDYDTYLKQFAKAVSALLQIAPTVDSVDELTDEKAQLKFIRAFRELMRILNTLKGFMQFNWQDLPLHKQQFEDYKSKYLDLYDIIQKTEHEKASILSEVDFELELIRRDEINVAYILRLLTEAHKGRADKREKTRTHVLSLLANEPQLRSKRELIEEFITQYWDDMPAAQDPEKAFKAFWENQRTDQLAQICKTEALKPDAVDRLIDRYHFNGQKPSGDAIVATMNDEPRLLEREARINHVRKKIMTLIDIFDTDPP
ncbi:MAG: type I restriction endonuclease subunit R [Pseudomonadota bacterium]